MLRVGKWCAFALSLFLVHCGGSSDDDTGAAAGGTGNGGSGGSSTGGSGNASTGGDGGTAAGGTAGTATGGSGGSGATTAQSCFASKYDGVVFVNYDQFTPTVNSTCTGTNHQDIQDVERVVFLGDSITVGTFPTPGNQVYRELLTNAVKGKWPNVQVDNCAVNGAETDDFFGGDKQIADCFPGPETKKTLTIFTMGGNDIKGMATDKMGATEALAEADNIIGNLEETITYLKDPVNFPNGSFVVFANIYEYTDLTADLGACPTANLIGLSGEWIAATATLVKLREGYMKVAVDHGADMIFLGEDFCGHGYKANDQTGQCYEPNSANWFDISCIHPTPEGHQHVADMFWKTIEE